MATESEFEGRNFKDTTVPREPRRQGTRPLKRVLSASDKLRLVYITGDETGKSPRDGGRSWRGMKEKK